MNFLDFVSLVICLLSACFPLALQIWGRAMQKCEWILYYSSVSDTHAITHTHTHTAATAQREKEAATGLEPLKHTRCYRQTNSARTRQDNLSFEVSSSFSLYGTNRKKKRRVPLEKFWWRREFKWRIKKPIATRIRPSELALSLWRICRVAFAIGSEKEARIAPFALYACVPIY